MSDRELLDQQVRDAVKAVEDACVAFRVVHNRRAALADAPYKDNAVFEAAALRDADAPR